jgi:hypothetical protein
MTWIGHARTYDLHRVMNPLSNHILLPWLPYIHQEMFNALSLGLRHLIGDHIHASVDLHRVSIDNPGTIPGVTLRILSHSQGKLDGEF